MSKQLLIIDDQFSTRKMLSHYFKHFYTVTEMDSAEKALDWIRAGNEPNAILADILMPEMSGIEFLHELNSEREEIPPVLMLTSVENSSEKLKCFQAGAKDYVLKPFNPEELRLRIQNAIKK